MIIPINPEYIPEITKRNNTASKNTTKTIDFQPHDSFENNTNHPTKMTGRTNNNKGIYI